MTDNDSAVTAAELNDLEKHLAASIKLQAGTGFVRLKLGTAHTIADAIASLRKQLAEARLQGAQEFGEGLCREGELLTEIDALRADNAQMAAALRDVQSWVKSYVEPKGIFASGQVLLTIERALAPASPSPGLREAVIEECAKVADRHRPNGTIGSNDWDIASHKIAASIRALSRPVSEREDGQ